MALYETDADLKQNTRDECVAHIGFSIDSFKNIEQLLKDLKVKFHNN